jgi:hypothetical protein
MADGREGVEHIIHCTKDFSKTHYLRRCTMKTTTNAIFCKLFVLVVLVFSSTMLRAQGVVIKEKVTIDPQRPINTISKALGSSRTHSLEIIATWDADVSVSLSVTNTAGTSTTTSPLNYKVDAVPPGQYSIGFGLCVAQLGVGQSTLVNLRVLVDGVEKINANSRFYGGSFIDIWKIWWNTVDIWFNTNFYFSLQTSSLKYEMTRNLGFGLTHYEGNEEFFPSADILTMTMTDGTEYASFYDVATHSRLGTSYSGTMNDLRKVALATDGILPPLNGAQVSVEVSGWKDLKISSINVYPDSLILTPPQQISFNGLAGISIDNNYEQWGRYAIVYIEKGFSYGTLGYSNQRGGDTLIDFPIGNTFQFYANEQEPDTIVEVKICAKRTHYGLESSIKYPYDFAVTGKDTLSGSTTITITPLQKLILTTQDAILAPLGDNDNKGPTNAKVIDYSLVKPTAVTVSVKMPNGNPVSDYPFTLSAYVRPNSGGHDHTDNRPTGRFIVKTDTVATFSDKTGSDGTAKYPYLCSGFGGVDSLRVKGKTDKDTSTAIILLKMGNFVELTAGEHYSLVGSIDPHVKNHFGRNETITTLKEIADSVYAKFVINIQYNDMSLIYGGPFDCRSNSRWNTPHQTHREGTNVDVRPTIKLEWLQKIFARNNWGKILEEDKGGSNHHYHFTIQ